MSARRRASLPTKRNAAVLARRRDAARRARGGGVRGGARPRRRARGGAGAAAVAGGRFTAVRRLLAAAAGAAAGCGGDGDDCGVARTGSVRQLRRAGVVVAPRAAALCWAGSPAQVATGAICRSGAARERLLGRLLGAAATGMIAGRPGALLAGSCGVRAPWQRRQRQPYTGLTAQRSRRWDAGLGRRGSGCWGGCWAQRRRGSLWGDRGRHWPAAAASQRFGSGVSGGLMSNCLCVHPCDCPNGSFAAV